MLFKITPILAVLVCGVHSASPESHNLPRAHYASLNPPLSVISHARTHIVVPQVNSRSPSLTNGQRLAAGLPLKPPQRRDDSAPKATPSGTPAFATGYIQVIDTQSGVSLGFVSGDSNVFGEFQVTKRPRNRLSVVINLKNAAHNPVNIRTVNGPDAAFPFFGGIRGVSSSSADLSAGSPNYAYLGSTSSTTPNAPPKRGPNAFTDATGIREQIESAIWTYDSPTRTISPQWVNTNRTHPTTSIAYIQGILVLVGDKNAFVQTYGPAQFVSLRFEPII